MSRAPRFRLQKDLNQPEIVSALEAIGCDVLVLHAPVDLMVGYRGRTLLLEVKNGRKRPSARKLTPAQVKFHASWRGHKAKVETPQEAIDAVMAAVA